MESRKDYNDLYLGTILLIKASKKIGNYNTILGDVMMGIADTLTNELEDKFELYNSTNCDCNKDENCDCSPNTEQEIESEDDKKIKEELELLVKAVRNEKKITGD